MTAPNSAPMALAYCRAIFPVIVISMKEDGRDLRTRETSKSFNQPRGSGAKVH